MKERCDLLRPGALAMLELCTCGSWDVEVWWVGFLLDICTCQRCGRQWSAREECEFGYHGGSPRWMVGLPAVNAKQFLSPEAQAAGKAAQDLYLLQADHKKWREAQKPKRDP